VKIFHVLEVGSVPVRISLLPFLLSTAFITWLSTARDIATQFLVETVQTVICLRSAKIPTNLERYLKGVEEAAKLDREESEKSRKAFENAPFTNRKW